MAAGEFDREALKRQQQTVHDVIAKRDARAFSQLYTADGELYPPSGVRVAGRENLEKLFRSWFKNGFCGQSAEVDSLVVSGDLAVETGRASGFVKAQDGSISEAKCYYVIVHQRQRDGAWLMLRDIWTLIPAE